MSCCQPGWPWPPPEQTGAEQWCAGAWPGIEGEQAPQHTPAGKRSERCYWELHAVMLQLKLPHMYKNITPGLQGVYIGMPPQP